MTKSEKVSTVFTQSIPVEQVLNVDLMLRRLSEHARSRCQEFSGFFFMLHLLYVLYRTSSIYL